ncbi:MAG: 4'-phosphopantetheinyl transferase superfamily protein [Butyrivibrio sp.]|nr:4'-phosphopantetheinyl transferase superfamily protein [Butyrivibrio sp.]
MSDCKSNGMDFGNNGKLSVEEQKEISKKMLEQGFSQFFEEKFLWENVTREEHGKPLYALGRFFNISHCHDGVAVALARVPVGVDIEGSRRVKTSTVRKCMDEEEKAYIGDLAGEWLDKEQEKRFFHLWTLKESYVKMTGEGIRMPLNQICFSLKENRQAFRRENFIEEGGEKGKILYADSRVWAPWQKSSVSCLLPVPCHSLALSLGWESEFLPEITYSFSAGALKDL